MKIEPYPHGDTIMYLKVVDITDDEPDDEEPDDEDDTQRRIEQAFAAVQRLISLTPNNEYKKSALQVFTTAT